MKLDISIMHEQFLRSLSLVVHFHKKLIQNIEMKCSFSKMGKGSQRILSNGYSFSRSNRKVKLDIFLIHAFAP